MWKESGSQCTSTGNLFRKLELRKDFQYLFKRWVTHKTARLADNNRSNFRPFKGSSIKTVSLIRSNRRQKRKKIAQIHYGQLVYELGIDKDWRTILRKMNRAINISPTPIRTVMLMLLLLRILEASVLVPYRKTWCVFDCF